MALPSLLARSRARPGSLFPALALWAVPLLSCSVELAGLGEDPYEQSENGALADDAGLAEGGDAAALDASGGEGPLPDGQGGQPEGGRDAELGDGGASGLRVGVLSSPSFSDGAALPDTATCNGENQSPAFQWTDGPPGTRSYALVLSRVDQDGTSTAQWALWDIAANVRSVPAAVQVGGSPGNVPGARQANAVTIPSDVFLPYYRGPCASFTAQEFVFTLYALDVAVIPLGAQIGPEPVVSWIEASGKVLSSSELRTPVP